MGGNRLERREFLKLASLSLAGLAAACSPLRNLGSTPVPTKTRLPVFPKDTPTLELLPTIEAQNLSLGKMLFLTKQNALWLAEPDGSQKKLVVDNSQGWVSWSPNGKNFASVLNGKKWKDSFDMEHQDISLAVFNENGGQEMEFDLGFDRVRFNSLSWAQDGQSIVDGFIEYDPATGKIQEIYSTIFDTVQQEVDNSLSISPDRKTIVYVNHTYGMYSTVFSLPYDVSKFPYKNYEDNGPFIRENINLIPERKIIFTNPQGQPDQVHDRSFDFSWTPDGKRLIFPYGTQLYIITLGVDTPELIDSFYVNQISMSHDGQKVAGIGNILAIADINNQKTKRIILPEQLQSSVVHGWLPGDRQIVFYDNGGNIYVINPDGSNLQKVQINNQGDAPVATIFQNGN
jgi:Tol biopolymer transport system component